MTDNDIESVGMKKRLDSMVAEKEKISREKAQALIMAGVVFIDGKKSDKSGTQVGDDLEIEVKEKSPYVSRGALKLEKAVKEFGISFKDKVVCDVGASTGGFTDFVLQNGAKKVYAIDSGYGQLDLRLRNDKRVINMERTNIKEVDSLPEPVDVFTCDVSFISLKQVLPAIQTLIQNCCHSDRVKQVEESLYDEDKGSLRFGRDDKRRVDIVVLIKPQFEVGKKIADRYKGVIKDEKIRQAVVNDIKDFAESIGYKVQGLTESPITGAKGNKEFLLYLNSK